MSVVEISVSVPCEQDEIQKKFKDTSALHTMAWMNFWCSIYYGAYLFGATGIGADLVTFCLSHSDVALDLLLFCLCGAFGQVQLRNPNV